MRDSLAETEQGLLESDREFHVQIVADASECLVLLLADCEDQVAPYHVRNLLAFLFANDRVAVRDAWVDVDVYRHFL